MLAGNLASNNGLIESFQAKSISSSWVSTEYPVLLHVKQMIVISSASGERHSARRFILHFDAVNEGDSCGKIGRRWVGENAHKLYTSANSDLFPASIPALK